MMPFATMMMARTWPPTQMARIDSHHVRPRATKEATADHWLALTRSDIQYAANVSVVHVQPSRRTGSLSKCRQMSGQVPKYPARNAHVKVAWQKEQYWISALRLVQ